MEVLKVVGLDGGVGVVVGDGGVEGLVEAVEVVEEGGDFGLEVGEFDIRELLLGAILNNLEINFLQNNIELI